MKTTMCRFWLSVLLCGAACTAAEAYQLAHRWSFNGDYADSVTGAEATKTGQDVTIADGQLVLSGNGHGAGALNLGTGVISSGDTTLEIWATQNAIRNWARLFDCFKDNQNFIFISLVQGTDISNDRVELTYGNQNKFKIDRTMSPHVLGTQYHFVMTLKVNDNGSTTIRWMCRDPMTGHTTDRSATVDDWTPAVMADWAFYLGRSAWDGDYDAAASYDEVRVWKGILSDEQLAANTIMGPDAIPLTIGDDAATGFSIGANQTYIIDKADGFVCYDGIVTLGSNAKIRFDTANAKQPVMRFKSGGFVCPGSTILDYVELTDTANYTAALEDDGNTIVVSLNASIPATAIWSGTTAPTTAEDLANPANWTCHDASGAAMADTVPGAKTLVIIPEGTTTFTIPLGVVPVWGGVQFGFGIRAPIRGGRINYGDNRGGMADYNWLTIGSNAYTLLDSNEDPLTVIAGTNYIVKSQLRFDGWFRVSDDQEGIWQFRQQLDDYSALSIDGEGILRCDSWNYETFATRAIAAGWHRFSLVCGDTYGGYGPSVTLADYEIKVPIAVRLPGADEEIPFPSDGLTLGDEIGTITLGGDCDWSELGPLTITDGTIIDMNGHNLIVNDVTGTYMGAMIRSPTRPARYPR